MSLLNCISLPECVWELWISLQQCLSKLLKKKKKDTQQEMHFIMYLSMHMHKHTYNI